MSKDSCSSFTWAINNYSYYWQKNDEAIVSPMFCIYMPEETKWKLLLFPRGTSDPEYISFFLYRDKDCNGAANIKVDYSLDILTIEGSFLVRGLKTDEFQKDMRKGYTMYTQIITKASRYIEQDILTIRCKMIQLDGKAMEMRKIFARTIIGIEKRFFHCPIENFSNLAPDQTQSFVINSESKEAGYSPVLYTTENHPQPTSLILYYANPCLLISLVNNVQRTPSLLYYIPTLASFPYLRTYNLNGVEELRWEPKAFIHDRSIPRKSDIFTPKPVFNAKN
ncbi:hypothetical protein AVEN_31869-1 [Araneus ventricosus]|uniref:MATH domain-containing protein n=1 Tax=Araneus ventricosus TaxID=182803 RepID=A0A4Y2F8M4_ARAVE|nr:hypothetical protein AVEN_31869-1 [Araneus ventricosus]